MIFSERYFRSNSIFVEFIDRNTISQEGLKGKKIGVQHQTLQEKYLKETYGTTATIAPFSNFEDMIKALREHRVDLAFMDSLPAYYFLQSDAGQGLDIVGDPVNLGNALGIVLNKSLTAERDAINQAILDLRDSGEYDIINRKYFDFSVY